MAALPPPPPWLAPGANKEYSKAESGGDPEVDGVEITRFGGISNSTQRPDPRSKTSIRLHRRTLENLSPKMKARRDRFISEYIKDWDPTAAWIRAGLPPATSNRASHEFLREPYVAQELQRIRDAMEEAKFIDNKTILAGLIKEARYEGIGASHGARVTAWKALANIKGMEQTNVNVKGNVDVRGGVMLVPVVPGTAEWEKLAQNTQKQLKEEVRSSPNAANATVEVASTGRSGSSD